MSKKFVALLVSFLTFALTTQASVPTGWYLAGSRPSNYETGVDTDSTYSGRPSAFLKCTHAGEGFGTLMQDISSDRYAGKRVRFSAFVKTEDANSAGLWLRVDKGTSSVAFDNMQDRALKGTSGWQRYAVVLDVPKEATGIFFGVLLSGSGKVWINSGNFEIVGEDVPTTGSSANRQRPLEPVNLSFDGQ
jgi:hypothetical protein